MLDVHACYGVSRKSTTSCEWLARVLHYVRSWNEVSEVGGQIKDIQVLILHTQK